MASPPAFFYLEQNMANARKHDFLPIEALITTGTVTPNSRDRWKSLTMTGNVTLNPPTDRYPGDEYRFYIDPAGFTLTLDAAYTSYETPAPPIVEPVILEAVVLADGTLNYWVVGADQRTTETLATTGTVTPNRTDKTKVLAMTGNVTLNPPTGSVDGDEYRFYITLGGFTLTLDAAYTSQLTTPPTILENTIMAVENVGGTLYYWLEETGA